MTTPSIPQAAISGNQQTVLHRADVEQIESDALLAGRRRPGNRNRSPAVPVVFCLIAGIVLDRWLSLPLFVWLSAAAVCALCWLYFFRRRIDRFAATAVLVCVVCLGGARHHAFWSLGRSDDLSLFAGVSPQPVRLVGILAEQPQIRAREGDPILSAWPRVDRSSCIMECLTLHSQNRRLPVSGFSLLSVSGHLLHVDAGDVVEVRGWLQRPAAPRNPGAFDYPTYLRQQGIRSIVTAAHPDAVARLRPSHDRRRTRWMGRMRRTCESLLVRELSPDVLPVASALLLGDRSQLTRDIRDSFAESGAMHLLAISGLHVGILALLVWFLCRAVRLSPIAASLVVVASAVGYALMIETRPPAVRAAVFIAIWAAGLPWFRRSSWENMLAVCGLVILIWNPADLFNVGAQLSFLAVVAIMASATWLGTGRMPARHPAFQAGQSAFPAVDRDRRAVTGLPHPGGHRYSLRYLFREAAGWLLRGVLVTAAVWVFTAPLIATRFHLVTPVGLLINVILLPVVTIVLWLGFALMTLGQLLPIAAGPLAWSFEFVLRCLLWIVDSASAWKLAHVSLAGPPAWWLTGYYLLLAIAVWGRSRRPMRRRAAVWILSWTVLGLGAALLPSRSEGLRCTFLSVGHGCAVLVEMPNGKTIAYDAGALHDTRAAATALQNALWQRGGSSLDAIVVSHADVDHFNGVPELLRTLPVGCILLAQPFLDFEQRAVVRLCDTAAAENVPIQLITQGDRLLADQSVKVQVLHPSGRGRRPGDNANSTVILIEYANRRILLPGDLDGEGMQQLLAQPPCDVDVLLAPHHGGAQANTPELAAWAQPECVVVSTGRPHVGKRLRAVYSPLTTILSTEDQGAVTVRIDPGGRIAVDTAAGHL